ncbi:MAG: CCA tRNA nucleotidyltransferase [Nitriliruptorales bacterium]|nr:CCA tRNA nucleotidyltransferase [Nitriliruptorales bacterium]
MSELDDEHAAQLGRMLDVFPEARELGGRFAAAGHELYLVGGAVRDTLLAAGDASVVDQLDLDFATSARPDETERIVRPWASAVWLTGSEFGTVSCEHAAADGRKRIVEITTFRSDAYTPGSRHPQVEFGETIEGDLARRDFTMNAMAVRVPEFRFVDLFGGLSDLNARRLRTPIDPHTSFSDDPLRMLRLARFAARFDATVDDDTYTAAQLLAPRLDDISAERIRDELVKLICSPHPDVGINLVLALGLDPWVIPELRPLRECADPMHRHKDVYRHTLAVIRNTMELEGDQPDFTLRMAALLHDIAKPQTRRIHDDGTVSFLHHDMEGARVAQRRMEELRFDRKTTNDVADLVRMHLRFHTYRQGWTDSAVRRYVRDAGPLLERLNALTRADVTTGNQRRANAIQRRMDELEERIDILREQEELDRLRPPIDGNQIMAHLGIPPGKDVGRAWNHLLELRIERGSMTEEEALQELDEWWAGQE